MFGVGSSGSSRERVHGSESPISRARSEELKGKERGRCSSDTNASDRQHASRESSRERDGHAEVSSSSAASTKPHVHKMSLHESLKHGAEVVKLSAESLVREYKSTSEIPKRKRGEKSRSIDPTAFSAKGRPVPKIVIDGTHY